MMAKWNAWLTPCRRACGVDLGLLVMRLTFGGLMMTHGWMKLANYDKMLTMFGDPIGLGTELSLILCIGAEFGCALLVALGLATRLATLPLIFTMGVAAFIAHGGDPLAKKEMALLYLLAYVAILLAGPGRFALDSLLCRCCGKGATSCAAPAAK